MFAYIFFIRFNKMIYNATTELVGTFFNIFRFFCRSWARQLFVIQTTNDKKNCD